ncbi:hypothetical protein [uncultured Treponema sp.]|nr:hypothetical protein [uncultured Treponema sp.]
MLTFAVLFFCSVALIADIVSLVIAPVTAMLCGPALDKELIASAMLSAVVVIGGFSFSLEVLEFVGFVTCSLLSSEPELEPSEQPVNVNARLTARKQAKIQWGG